MFDRVRKVYAEFPGQFWTLTGATFIDQLGGALLFPFFALYVTDHFGVGLTEVGILFFIFASASVIGSLMGGALTDKLGRRWMLMFGLIFSASSSLAMAFVDDLVIFYVLAAIVGLLSNAGGPAAQAMVADLLPEEKVAEGYGMQRVSANLAVAIGPAIGGLLASQSFLWLFGIDAATSLITAVIVFFTLPETKPEATEEHPEESISQSLGGYKRVFKDRLFIAFLLISMVTVLIYTQLNSTLSVYLRDVHGVTLKQFGLLLSLNAAMVVMFQFWITRRISKRSPMLMMALGTALYGIGFVMYGIFGAMVFFVIAMIIITVGEMITVPVAQALVARFSPEDMRGRYMAIYGFSWTIPFALGPLLAGLVIDNLDPRIVWYAAGVLSVIAVIGFLGLNPRVPALVGPDVNGQSTPENVLEPQQAMEIMLKVDPDDII